MVRVIMHGCNGRMGQVITEMIAKEAEMEIVAGVDLSDHIQNSYPVFKSMKDCDVEADVVIDFANAKAVDGLLDVCVERNLPCVLCTTGLSEEQLAHVKEASGKVAILRSANMSMGINLLMKLLKDAVPVLAAAGYDMEIVEKHHNQKLDAPSGQTACMATVLRISARYGNLDTLEEGYGINLIPLATFALKTYENSDCSVFSINYGADYDVKDLKLDMMMHKAIAIIQFKLEGQLILAHPEYHMDDRLLLDKIDFEKGTVRIGDKEYEMLDSDFPTVDPKDPYRLTAEEEQVVERLRHAFVHCEKLQKHVRFLFAKGSMYKIFNSNLLYHGCVPMDEDGNFEQINVYGKLCSGKKLYEVLETYARKGYYSQDKEERRKGRDTLWYIWAGPKSPVFGKDKMATFERYFIADKETHKETKNAYYRLYDNEEILNKILREFGLDEHRSHIINGHVPVEIKRGETPIKCNGKLLIIDGGFSKAYQGKTGIAGYTLVANSHGMNLVEHRPFVSAEDAIRNETDMVSDNILIETAKRRILVADTDIGRELKESIGHLEKLLNAYRDGILIEKGI